MSRRDKLLQIIKELVKMPSITESAAESMPAQWIYKRLGKLEYFTENPQNIKYIPTPLEGAEEELHAVVAIVNSLNKTNRTVLMLGHFDVVDISCYGEMAKYAFDADKLTKNLSSRNDILYGRGVMDMKCGVALMLDIVEEFASNREMFDVNIVAAFVGDEENSSAGMRGVVPLLSQMHESGTDFLCALNTEPGEAGQTGISGPMIFLGTLGKLMPSFYIKGRGAHVGNYYQGFSSALIAAKIVSIAEGAPELADPQHGNCEPSWICLDINAMRKTYNVTVPDCSYVYFNCFTTSNTPAVILEQMKNVALRAIEDGNEQLKVSCDAVKEHGFNGSAFNPAAPKVFLLSDLVNRARKNCENFDDEIQKFIEVLPKGDMRARGISIVNKISELSCEDGPYVVCFFLPPWLPVRTDSTDNVRDKAVVKVAREIENELKEKYAMKMTEVELFAGLCDLSYVGGRISDVDARSYEENLPGWGIVYGMPLDAMKELGMPVMNIGPSGEGAHKKDEYLNLRYSLDILPRILRSTIRRLSDTIV